MSLKRKDYQTGGQPQQQQQQQGLRVAAGDPHLVSLGGGRLSTAVTIHHLPIGKCVWPLCIVLSVPIFPVPELMTCIVNWGCVQKEINCSKTDFVCR